MNEFLFEQAPWEAYLNSCKPGAPVSAWNLLAMLEGEEEDTVEEAFQMLEERALSLDLSSFPKISGSGQSEQRLKQEEEYVKSGFHMEQMEENDPLRLYLEELAGIPAAGDEILLASQLASGSQKAASVLLDLGLNRVIQIASEFVGFQVLLMDLIQEGSMGLWEGLQSYSGESYPEFRDRKIRNSMAKAVMLQSRSNGICQKIRCSLQDYRDTDERLLLELGRTPSLEEIAAHMHISVEEAETIRKMLEDVLLVQKNEQLTEPKQEDSDDDLAVEDTAYFQMRQRIGELLSQLSAEDAELLTLRFGLEQGLPMNHEETARALGITVNEVISREAAALAKLRTGEKM